MRDLVVRELDDDIISRLEQRAEVSGTSLSDVVRVILESALRPDRQKLAAELARIRAMGPSWRPGMPLSEDLIREDRDSH